jgi:hypothetical protein
MPILMINGANDPYWATDAARFYFDDLPSKRKYALYVPNGGHGLGDFDRVVNSLCAFYLMSIGAMEFPTRLEATHSLAGDEVVFRVRTDAAPEIVEVWVARRAKRQGLPPRALGACARPQGRRCVGRPYPAPRRQPRPVRRNHPPRRDGQLLTLHDTRHCRQVGWLPPHFYQF